MTPYDDIFARAEFEDEIFPAITQDAAEHGMDPWNVDEFLQLPASGDLREKLAPAGMAETTPVTGVAALGFHGYHFWRNGKVSHTLDEAQTRALLDPAAPMIGEWRLRGPATAGYVTLPANLVWAKTEDATPEPVHGFFYATSPADNAADRVDVLVALGVRADRAGFTAIELSIPLPAPITALSPMVTPGRMIAPPPIHTFSPITTGRPNSRPQAPRSPSRRLTLAPRPHAWPLSTAPWRSSGASTSS